MKKLITTNTGGMPINLDDIRWEQEATRDAIYGIMSAFGITKPLSFVLSGCVVTKVGNDYSWTDGYISLAGEICKVVAGSMTAGTGEAACWEIQPAYDPAGTKVFEDSTSHDCYEIRNAALESHVLTYPQTRMRYDAPTFAEVIAQKAGPYIPGTWYEVGSGTPVPDFENSWAATTATPARAALGYMKDLAGVVHLRGSASHSGSSAGNVFTLPYGYRPSAQLQFVVWSHTTSAYAVAFIEILSSGDVYIRSANLVEISLDGISFHI